MEKVLLVSRLGKFFSDFELSDISILQEMGYEVWCVGNFDNDNHKLDETGVKKLHLSFRRSPLSIENIRECKKLVNIIKENDFKLMHCHMPIGGVFARIAARKTGMHPVIYTAHGFQFVKGGPKRDWLLFYPVEKFLSRWTDVLITINQEDYTLASKKFRAKKNVYLKGIGIEVDKFANGVDIRGQLCEQLGIGKEGYLLLSVGELSKRKNHEVVIRGMEKHRGEDVYYLIAGVGATDEYLKSLVKELNLEGQVHFLGWRDDIADLCNSVDAFVFPSKREGLPVAMMEAMSAGLPLIAAQARGNTELVDDGVNGILCRKNIPEEYAEAIEKIKGMDKSRASVRNREMIKEYELPKIQERMKALYAEVLLKS